MDDHINLFKWFNFYKYSYLNEWMASYLNSIVFDWTGALLISSIPFNLGCVGSFFFFLFSLFFILLYIEWAGSFLLLLLYLSLLSSSLSPFFIAFFFKKIRSHQDNFLRGVSTLNLVRYNNIFGWPNRVWNGGQVILITVLIMILLSMLIIMF